MIQICDYSDGFEFMNQKWMEEMEEDNESNDSEAYNHHCPHLLDWSLV